MTTLDQAGRNAADATGDGPTGGFAPLVPELDVTNLDNSLHFWCDLLGFRIAYQRPQARFAYLERQGAQLMLCEINGEWMTGSLERPFGRGINFQIEVDDVQPALEALQQAQRPLFRDVRESWYRIGATRESGSREFLVQDPDGYLVRLSQSLGQRDLAP